MILLYNPASSANRKAVLPISLLTLGALLEDRRPYRIVDGNLESDPLKTLRTTILSNDVTILGVTVMPGPQLLEATEICRKLKTEFPELAVVWGGYFPTQHWKACLESGFVDYVVRGHGEFAFRDLVESLLLDRRPVEVPGIVWRCPESGEILGGSHLAPIPHPEDLPDLPYNSVEMSRYVRPTFLGSQTLSHHSSYGCPFLCNFCAVVNMVEGRWLGQSAEKVATVTKKLVEDYGANAIEFFDNNFFVKESRVAEYAERISGLGISWWGEARIDTLLQFSETTWGLMKKSGLKMVFMGAESGSDQTLEIMNKGGKADTSKTLEISRKMRSYGIIPEFSFIVGNPPEPEADFQETASFIRRIKEVNPSSEIVIYPYTPVGLAGSLYDAAVASGFRFPETLEEWCSAEWQRFSRRESPFEGWGHSTLSRKVRDFRSVLNAYFPTETDVTKGVWSRRLLRFVSGWRYRSRFYRFPYELRLLDRVIAYQRPETSGF